MHPQPLIHYGQLHLHELVNKIETSATLHRKRMNNLCQRIRLVSKEHQRIALVKNLKAIAITLTYAEDTAFCSKHISRFVDCLRAKLKRKGHSLLYIWTLERASRLHYHLIIWIPRRFNLTSEDIGRWWQWGSTWNEACRKASNWVRYIRKSKAKGTLPQSARVFGYGGLDDHGKKVVAWAMLPKWLATQLPSDSKPIRVPGCGWVDKSSGVIYKSPWQWDPRGFRAVASPDT